MLCYLLPTLSGLNLRQPMRDYLPLALMVSKVMMGGGNDGASSDEEEEEDGEHGIDPADERAKVGGGRRWVVARIPVNSPDYFSCLRVLSTRPQSHMMGCILDIISFIMLHPSSYHSGIFSERKRSPSFQGNTTVSFKAYFCFIPRIPIQRNDGHLRYCCRLDDPERKRSGKRATRRSAIRGKWET